ncbi:MAG: LacI family DNA-binding transcriptional regulator [Chloroflexia bacterium]
MSGGVGARTGRATSLDVARLAGVNQSTVSRALRDDPRVAAGTRARVLAAARELGYTPDAIARSLITRRTDLVAIVMAGLASPFQPYVLDKFIRELGAAGMRPLVFSAPQGREVDDILPAALAYRPDALIVTSATLSSGRVAECARHGTPVILFNRTLPGSAASAVCCDNAEGGRLVADLLIDAGHQRLAYIAGSANSSTNRDRERGFADRLRERGSARFRREQAAYTYEAGYAAARALLARDDPPDAVFCASDIIALGVRDIARELGIRVPEELALVGFDDIPMAGWAAYDLTTIRQPVDRMIAATLALLREPAKSPETHLFPGELVVRGSTRGIPRRPLP